MLETYTVKERDTGKERDTDKETHTQKQTHQKIETKPIKDKNKHDKNKQHKNFKKYIRKTKNKNIQITKPSESSLRVTKNHFFLKNS